MRSAEAVFEMPRAEAFFGACALAEARLLKCRALKHTVRVFSFAQWAFYSRHPPKSASFKPPLHAARPLIVTWF